MFFASTAPGRALHEELAEKNRVFHRLHEDFRHPKSVSLIGGSIAKTTIGKVDEAMEERIAKRAKGNVGEEEDISMADA